MNRVHEHTFTVEQATEHKETRLEMPNKTTHNRHSKRTNTHTHTKKKQKKKTKAKKKKKKKKQAKEKRIEYKKGTRMSNFGVVRLDFECVSVD